MVKDTKGVKGQPKRIRRHYFVARELQCSLAILVVLALLGGIFLQSVSATLTANFGFQTPVLSIILTIGYILLVVFLAIFFSHRLVGPFKRLEYEMGHIMMGELNRRLSTRSRDDLHVRNFIKETNVLIENFENMNKSYEKLEKRLTTGLVEVKEELSRGNFECDDVREALDDLMSEVQEFREKH